MSQFEIKYGIHICRFAEKPVLPLRLIGDIRVDKRDWENPKALWALDSANQCWMGQPNEMLSKVETNTLCEALREEGEGQERQIEKYLKDQQYRFRCTKSSREFAFEERPALPFKMYGELYHQGWDIPTLWAIDANNQCWADNAHGTDLEKVTDNFLISSHESEHEDRMADEIRKALGLPLPEPEPTWEQLAKRNGWTAPENAERTKRALALLEEFERFDKYMEEDGTIPDSRWQHLRLIAKGKRR